MTGEPGWAAVESPAPASAGYDLRPLSTGEILDRTFQLYRSRFALFASLAALPAAVNFAGSAIGVLFMRTEHLTRHGRAMSIPVQSATSLSISGVTLLAFFIVNGITLAATTWAVAEIYLGKAASVRAAWRSAMEHWFRYVRVVLRQYWSVLWLPLVGGVVLGLVFVVPGATAKGILGVVAGLLLFGSFIYAIYAAIRVSLAVPAAVIESLRANAAVRRSMELLTERKVRIFLLWLLVLAMGMVIGAVLSPLQWLILRAQGGERYLFQMLQLTGVFFSRLLVVPVGAIALCLFYFDERVRHEGFDIEFLMQRAGGAPPLLPAEAPDKPFAEGSTSPDPA
ncbi:MAG TPA: hypothetical protein VME18_13660 [Acidobacteriaceae bacterium]|nr:hypothetical protein [Acidobacteriaceae bacterium]